MAFYWRGRRLESGYATLTFTGPITAKIKITDAQGEVSLNLKRA